MTKKIGFTNLNARQRRAVRYGLKHGPSPDIHPLLVIAGAGTGKTNTLAHRVAHMIEKGMDPRRILLLTFTRRAAEQMSDRVRQITQAGMGGREIDLPWAGTFHAIGAKLIGEYVARIGLSPFFTIIDQTDATDLMNLIRQNLGLSKTESPFPSKGSCLAIHSFKVNSGLSLREVLSTRFRTYGQWRRELRKLFQCYERTKAQQHVLDYDDLLLYWDKLMQTVNIAAEIRNRFDHILVDEYQDTNPLQAQILFALKPKGRGLTVVGDDAQAIYSFRGATVRNILDFPNLCKPTATVITLEQNYRSTQPILKAANSVMSFATERYSKALFSERRSEHKPYLTTVANEKEQARYVIQQMLDARENGVPLKSQAVLFRASGNSTELELELTRRMVPFVKYGGVKFVEAAHIKDIIGVLRWCENPHDHVAGFRILRLLPGIGSGTAAKVLKKIKDRRDVVKRLERVRVSGNSAKSWHGLAALVRQLNRGKKIWPNELQIVRKWYEPLLQFNYDDPEDRFPDLAQLEEIAGGYESRRQFLTDLTIDLPDPRQARHNGNNGDDYAILSTMHSAKGQEWPIVRILNVTDGCIPLAQADDVEEERRLLHVAMTRAKRELELIVPQQLSKYQISALAKHGAYGAVTRLVPPRARNAFDCRRWRDPP